MSCGTLHKMMFALLLYLACLLPEVMVDQNTEEIPKSFNTTLLLRGATQNPSSVFKVQWCAELNGTKKDIITFSPGSKTSYTHDNYKKRVTFSQTNFSLIIHRVTFSDEGVYTRVIQMNDGQLSKKSTKVTVIMPVSNVKIASDTSAPRLGKNVTLNCSVEAGNLVSYSWQKCNQHLPKGNRFILSEDNTSLTLLNIQQSDIGNYRCVVKNILSSEHHDFTLQLCAENDISPWMRYGICGYPGYLGYAIVIFYIFSWVRRTRKRCSENKPDVIYENADLENIPRNTHEKVRPVYISHRKK